MSTCFENIIKENAREYYTTGEQKLSDEVFDALVEKVKESNPDSDVLDSTGWGYKPDSIDKIKHKYCHVGSLSKVKTVADLLHKLNTEYVNVSAKLDGISCVLYFKQGKLDKALTRGDGTYGIDITNKLHYVKGFTYEIVDKTFTGAVRGEIFMTPMDYNKFKLKYPDAKNARNSTAGLINSNEDTVSPEDYGFMSLYVYTVVASEKQMSLDVTNTYTLYKWLELNFDFVAPHTEININENAFLKLKEEYENQVTIDGLVITDTVVAFDEQSKCFNYNQVAWKFQDEVKIAVVKCIEWTMSKHNAYIPVVVFEEPIELEGTQVQRATGYNAKWIKDMKIVSGSIVAVRKANMIIPQIIEVIK
jgi:DNA ligase (NAD+)